MAKVAEDFTFRNVGCSRDKYDWDSWFDGRAWHLIHGEDFTKPSFRATVSTAARRHGGHVRTSKVTDGLVIQFYRKAAE